MVSNAQVQRFARVQSLTAGGLPLLRLPCTGGGRDMSDATVGRTAATRCGTSRRRVRRYVAQLRKREQTNADNKFQAGWWTGGMWLCVVDDTLLYVSQQSRHAGRCDRPGGVWLD